MKPSLLTALSAVLLAAGVPAPAQQQPSLQPPVRAAMAQDCVAAGPSFGDCRAVGRYSQSYRDVEGGRPRGAVASVAASRADGTSTPAILADRKDAGPDRP